jgi:hypothetical protein
MLLFSVCCRYVYFALDKLFGFNDFLFDFPLSECVFFFSICLFEVKETHERELFFIFFLCDDN